MQLEQFGTVGRRGNVLAQEEQVVLVTWGAGDVSGVGTSLGATGPAKLRGSPRGASPSTVMLLCTHACSRFAAASVMDLGCQAP